jgi:hypothetical protein
LPAKKRPAPAGRFRFPVFTIVKVAREQHVPVASKKFGSWLAASDMLAICGEHAIRSVDE